MLVGGQQHGCLPYVIAIVSALSVGNPFLSANGLQGSDGQENSLDLDAELVHLTDETDKEARRSLRKAFFESQHVSLSLFPQH